MFNRFALGLATLLLVGVSAAVLAVFAKPTPLKSILMDSKHIAVARVESVDPARPSMKLVLIEDITGAAPEREVPINLTGDPNGKPLPSSPRDVTDRVKADMQAVVFFVDDLSNPFALIYVEGSWYRISRNAGDKAWRYLYPEVYLRRTFKGTTAEMKQAVLEVKDGKANPPFDLSEKPGLGPALPGVTAAPLLIPVKNEAKDGTDKAPSEPAKDSVAKDISAKDAAKSTAPKDAKSAGKPAPKPESSGAFRIVGGIVIVAGIALLVYVFVIRKKVA